MSTSLQKNVNVRKTAESFVDLGIDFATEDGIDDADGMRHFWKCVVAKACQLIGDDDPYDELQKWKDAVAQLKAQKKTRDGFVPNDSDPFPWGKFGPDGEGRNYGEVPTSYYQWLEREGCEDPHVAAYIEENF